VCPLADIFFTTTACLRDDVSKCWDKTSELYAITRSGLDAQVSGVPACDQCCKQAAGACTPG
jgi:hypothetical protein